MKRLLALLAACCLSLSPLYGADIYKWVDENGGAHFSDTVPEKFKKSATRIDSRQYELTSEQIRQAAARTARDQARAAEAVERDTKAAAAAPDPASSASAGLLSRAGDSDCATLRRRFAESNECFAPFFNRNGSVKVEAYAKCGSPVPYPARECASARQ